MKSPASSTADLAPRTTTSRIAEYTRDSSQPLGLTHQWEPDSDVMGFLFDMARAGVNVDRLINASIRKCMLAVLKQEGGAR